MKPIIMITTMTTATIMIIITTTTAIPIHTYRPGQGANR
jgi:hypothetical protein